MPEYLSPGVYVEEFESGSKPMEGVGTSTAGFIGLSVKGPDTVSYTHLDVYKRQLFRCKLFRSCH